MKIRLRSAIFFSVLISVFINISPGFGQEERLNPALSAYASAIRIRITQAVKVFLADHPAQGAVTLKLCINRDGILKEVVVSKSSGQEVLDDMAGSIVRTLFPFIPFPAQIKERQLWMEAPIVFDRGKPTAPVPALVSTDFPASVAKLAPADKLEEYSQIAIKNHLPMRVAKEQVDLSQLKIKEAERGYFPAVTGEYKSAKGKTITDPYQSISYGLQAEQLLLGLSQVRDTVTREKIGLEMAKKNYDKLTNDARYEVIKAYYELVSQTQMLKHWQDTLENLKSDLTLLQRLYEGGLAIAADFESAQSQYNLIQYQAFSAESAASLAKLSLVQAMNLDPAKVDELNVPAEFAFAAQDLGVDLLQCVALGLRFRPEIELWQMTSKSARINEIITRNENQPKLSMLSSYGRSGEAYAAQTLNLVDEWSLMGKLTWLWGPNSLEFSQTQDRVLPKNITDTTVKTESSTSNLKFSLADKLNYYTARKESSVTYHQSLTELNETKKKVVYEVKEAYLAYNRALVGINTSLSRLTFRENQLKIIKTRTEVGEGSPVELVEAKVELANEKASYLRSLGEYYLAVGALDRATDYHLLTAKTS